MNELAGLLVKVKAEYERLESVNAELLAALEALLKHSGLAAFPLNEYDMSQDAMLAVKCRAAIARAKGQP
jgi:hypothetical protein